MKSFVFVTYGRRFVAPLRPRHSGDLGVSGFRQEVV